MLPLLLFLLPLVHSKLLTYTVHQTNDICRDNWKGSVCLPIFPLSRTNQPFVIQINARHDQQCDGQALIYIRSRQCIYCPKHLSEVRCYRRRRMVPTSKEHIHRNSLIALSLGLLGILAIGILFAFLVIKRSAAHTNLLEAFDSQGKARSCPPPVKKIKIPVPRKQFLQPTRLPYPKSIKTSK